MMKNHLKIILSSFAAPCLLLPSQAFAQTSGETTFRLDEVTVTARKREETLTEVPVSISVLNDELIEDAGILTQQDLFDLVPGLQFDQPVDRNSASPSIRGVGSQELATNRTRVTQFIDGMPILGSQGNIQFGSVEQVEVFRGPQSAAFGRSTFGGAVNYVTKDPGEEFEAEADFDFSDYGRRRLGVSLGGPVPLGSLGDTLGYRLDYQWEDSTSPDEFEATDGTQFGALASDAWSGKLVWTPTDALSAELTYSHVESEDEQSVQYFIGEEAFSQCWDGVTISDMGDQAYADGQPNCDWRQGEPVISQFDRLPLIESRISNGQYTNAAGVTADVSQEDIDALLFLAEAESITQSEAGSFDERERFTAQIDYAFDNGGLAQFSAFTGTEQYSRIRDTDYSNQPLAIYLPGQVDDGFYSVEITGGDATETGGFMADPSNIEETYAEIRYVSADDSRLRYVLGASAYDYEFDTKVYIGGYGAIQDGADAIEAYNRLVGNYFTEDVTSVRPNGMTFTETFLTNANGDFILDENDERVEPNIQNGNEFGVLNPAISVLVPNQTFTETATNVGIYGNVSYDFTDNLTATFEARYQVDKVGAINEENGNGDEIETTAFLPRLSLNYNFDNGISVYGQYARGNNPGGVNVDFYDQSNIDQLNCAAFDYNLSADGNLQEEITTGAGRNAVTTLEEILDDNNDPVPSEDFVENPAYPEAALDFGTNNQSPCGQNYVDYTAETFQAYAEETIDNYEIGAKGQLFDGNLTFATAVFFMDWKDQGRTQTLDWGNPTAMGMQDFESSRGVINEGDIEMKGVEFEGTYQISNDFSVRGQFSYLDSEYTSYCDVDLNDGEYAAVVADSTLQRTAENSGTGYSCVDVSGRQVVQQADWTGSISPSYRKRLPNGLRFNARADVRYEGAQFIDTINQFETNPVTTTNVSAGLSGDKWAMTLYVNNLFDEDQPLRYSSGDIQTFDGDFTIPLTESVRYVVTPRAQRTIGLRGSVNY